jgi:hypothetical protein
MAPASSASFQNRLDRDPCSSQQLAHPTDSNIDVDHLADDLGQIRRSKRGRRQFVGHELESLDS